jgi:hypothetical protein
MSLKRRIRCIEEKISKAEESKTHPFIEFIIKSHNWLMNTEEGRKRWEERMKMIREKSVDELVEIFDPWKPKEQKKEK